MRAAVITRVGGPDVLEVREVAAPAPGPGEVRVAVQVSALNRADLLQRAGRYPAPPGAPADIGGIEFAGLVDSLGAGVEGWRRGDRVFGICGGGAHAEQVVVPAATLVAIPPDLPWEDAGAVPEAFMTAHDAMVTQAGLGAGELVLIHAVASGVGLAAVQLARALGARTFGTTRTAAKLDDALRLGLDDGMVITDNLGELGERVRATSNGRGADVVLDLLGGPYVPASIDAAAPGGRLMLVGAIAGSQATVDVRRILGRRLTLRGTVLRSRSVEEKAQVAAAFARDVLPLFEAGRLAANIDCTYPLSSIAEAHAQLEANANSGKVLIDLR